MSAIWGNTIGTGIDKENLENKVTSVNNKTGVVNLTAEDVGALPSDTPIPSVEGLASEQFVKDAIANIDLPTGGGGSEKDLYWQEEILAEGVILTTDTPTMIDTGITFGDVKNLDVVQFNYGGGGTVSGDFFIGFKEEANGQQWHICPLLFRGALTQQSGYVKIELYGGGAVAEIIASSAKPTSMDATRIATLSTRTFTTSNRSANMIRLKGATFSFDSGIHNYELTDDYKLVMYFSNAPTADLSWKMIGGKCDVLL